MPTIHQRGKTIRLANPALLTLDVMLDLDDTRMFDDMFDDTFDDMDSR